MARVRVVEILDGRGHVRARVRIDAFPSSIGRAFDNDVIVDDLYVSPHHLHLVEDDTGLLWAEDAGSTNGTRRADHRAPEQRFPVASGGSVVLGRTTLRIYDADHPVSAAVSHHREDRSFADVFSDRRVIAAGLGALALVFGVRGYLDSTSRDVGRSMLTMTIGVLLLTVLWSGLWALIGRMTHAGSRFRAHVGWACVGSVVLTLLSAVLGWIEFAIPSNDSVAVISGVLLAAAFAVYLAGHVTMASSFPPRQALQRTIIGFGAAALVGTLITLTSKEEFSSTPDFSTTLAPLPNALLQTESIDVFAARSLKLQKDVDELALKRERAGLISNPMKGR